MTVPVLGDQQHLIALHLGRLDSQRVPVSSHVNQKLQTSAAILAGASPSSSADATTETCKCGRVHDTSKSPGHHYASKKYHRNPHRNDKGASTAALRQRLQLGYRLTSETLCTPALRLGKLHAVLPP